MNKVLLFIMPFISTTAYCGEFPPFVEVALSKNGCENYDRFSEVNETSEYPFQYGYGNPETVIVWCKWKAEGYLLILPRDAEKSVSECPDEIKSTYRPAA
ncbi:hypothetical protein SAMN02745866_04084 [Alteromonadaceae bacterium Bs31]|nr:hypothetical protein SAMN02745866_04084 [Alteromonadaceae bacterium Bs31]